MSTIQFGGVVSGLNTQGIVDALVAAEKQPLTDLQTREASLTAQQTAYGSLGTAMDSVVTQIKNFTVTNAGSSRAATSTDNSVLTATAGTGAAVASYQISVQHLATSTRAMSTGALGAAITGNVDTSKMLASANLATPITAGNMTLTVDGTAVQVAVGNPATTTLQSILNSVASALQTQIQTTDTGTVTASIVNGQLQLAVVGNATTHTISFGAPTGQPADSSNLAVALGLSTQGVTNVQNPTISGAYLDANLQSLNLPGSVTAGQISAIVDGVLVHYTVGDPSKTTLDQVMAGFGAAIQSQLRAGGPGGLPAADAGATATFSVVGNKLQLSIAGGLNSHTLSFGASSDSSNALGILGIANSTSTGTNQTITGATSLGVARMVSALDSSGISGLTSVTAGTLKINGVSITYDTTKDSLSDVISRINKSGAGVVASIDRTNDKIVITRQSTGAMAIDITDATVNGVTGNLADALKLAPGTTNAQTLGQNALLTVDGRSIISASNTVTNAIDSVSVNLLDKSPIDQTETLTVGVDTAAVQSALNSLISSFNSLGDTLDSLTASKPGTKGGTAGSAGPLANDPTAMTLFLSLRDTVMQAIGSGVNNSLGAIGVSTGAVGAAVGTTTRLQLDTTKLTAALTSDPNGVASLLDGATGPLTALMSQLKVYEDPSNDQAYIQSNKVALTDQISAVQRREVNEQELIDNYTAMIEAQFTAMEATLATLQSQSAAIAAELGYSTTTSSTSSSSGVSNLSTGS